MSDNLARRLDDLELVQQLLVDIQTGNEPNVSRTLLAYRPSEIRAVHGFMRWIAMDKPSTWEALVEEWRRRLPQRSADDLARLWQAYRDDGVADGPIFDLKPASE